MHIRKDDMVEVITGDDADKGKVAKRAARPARQEQDRRRRRQPRLQAPRSRTAATRRAAGSRKEMPIAVSNVLLYCPTCRAASASAAATRPTASKERYCKKCGSGLGAR